jgi:hypothetical protein
MLITILDHDLNLIGIRTPKPRCGSVVGTLRFESDGRSAMFARPVARRTSALECSA